MKLNSLKTVMAMTAALGIAFVGISCKKPEGGGDAAGGGDDKKPAAEKKADGGAKKEDAAKPAEGEKKDAK